MKLIVEISETLKDIADKEDAKTFSHMMWQAILMDAIKNGIPHPCPCDLCRHNPPSSADGKPCSMCVAEGSE